MKLPIITASVLAVAAAVVAPGTPAAASGSCGVEGGHVVTVLLGGGVSRLTADGASIQLDGTDCGTGDVVSIFATTGVADSVVIDASDPWMDASGTMDVFISGLESDDSLRVITTREYDSVEMCTTAAGALELTSANEEARHLDITAESSASVPVRVDLRGGSDAFVHRPCSGTLTSAERITVYGRTGADNLFGGRGRQSLYGGPGRDAMDGGRGNDRLVGGDRADILRGGPGTDSCGCDALDTVTSIELGARDRR